MKIVPSDPFDNSVKKVLKRKMISFDFTFKTTSLYVKYELIFIDCICRDFNDIILLLPKKSKIIINKVFF